VGKYFRRELSIEEIKDMWLNTKVGEGRTFHIYVDNPFCFKACDYCIYSPVVTPVNSDIYKEYYTKTLPNEIEKFRDIIESKPFSTIYFGGGTASYMSTHIMRDIFDRIPNFDKIAGKKMEAHPSFFHKEKIDILAEYGFTHISLGVQSFDKRVIDKNNRLYNSPEKVKDLVEYAQSKNISVNCDLLAFIDNGDERDLDGIFRDLNILANEVGTDRITIYPMYQVLGKNSEDRNIELITQLRKKILLFLVKNKSWKATGDALAGSLEELTRQININYILKNTAKEINATVPLHSSTGPEEPQAEKQNVLALGTGGNREIYSYFGRDFAYYNVMKDNKIIYVTV